MKTLKERKITLTINRPDGSTEIVDVTEEFCGGLYHFKKVFFPRIKKGTYDAGRGDVVSFDYQEKEEEKEEADYFEKCDRCGEIVDTRIAKTNKETRRFGSIVAKLAIPYCDGCYNLMATIGMGEFTELEERAGKSPSYEMENKEE